MADLNQYTVNIMLVIILMHDTSLYAFGVFCDIRCYNLSTLFLALFSFFVLAVKEKVKQRRIKELTMVEWLNINWSNRSVVVHQYTSL